MFQEEEYILMVLLNVRILSEWWPDHSAHGKILRNSQRNLQHDVKVNQKWLWGKGRTKQVCVSLCGMRGGDNCHLKITKWDKKCSTDLFQIMVNCKTWIGKYRGCSCWYSPGSLEQAITSTMERTWPEISSYPINVFTIQWS